MPGYDVGAGQGRQAGQHPVARRGAHPLMLLGAVAALALLGGCDRSGEAPPPRAAAGATLMLAESEIPDLAELPATLTTRDTAEVRARIPGLLTELSVRAGDRVAAGQPLGRVTDSQLVQQEAALAAAAVAAEAEAARAKAELSRIAFLHREGVYADARLEQAQAGARAADAGARAARAREGAVAAVAGQGRLLSPAAGVVLTADVPVGSAVSPGMVIMTITAGPPVVRLDVPESVGAQLRPGMAVRLAGAGSSAATGAIVKVYPAVAGGRVRADALVPGLEPSRIGARATATVELGRRRALVVPADHVVSRFGLHFATLATPAGPADVPVEVKPLPDGRYEILSGLKPGDRLLRQPAGGRA